MEIKNEERLSKDLEVMVEVVDESREGLSKLAREEEAEKERSGSIKGIIRKIKNLFRNKQVKTAEITV